jgi:hypothetical protein
MMQRRPVNGRLNEFFSAEDEATIDGLEDVFQRTVSNASRPVRCLSVVSQTA